MTVGHLTTRHLTAVTFDRMTFEVNGLDWQFCLTGSSKTAPRIFIFSIVLDAEYLSYVKSIETHAGAFLTLNIVHTLTYQIMV